jgi:tetratricopeptide (TPR) repeat protein
MKISLLFNISCLLFVLLLGYGIVEQRLPPIDILVVVSFVLAVLSTQWFLPNLCARLAQFCIKKNRSDLAERFARIGIAFGKPWDSQFFKTTNLPRHMTPTMSCTNFLRIALHNQGKFDEQIILDREILKTVQTESGTAEGRGVAKAKLAASMHKTGDTIKALSLANEALDQFAIARLDENPREVGNESFMKSRKSAFQAELAHALFVRASILESIRRYDAARFDREKALKVAQDNFGEEAKEATPHMTMLGKLFVKMKEYEQARPYLQKSLELRLKLLEPSDKLISSAQLALSDYYREVGDLDQAESMLKVAVKAAEQNYNQSPGPGLAEYYQSTAFLRQKQGRVKEADEYFKKARKLHLKYFPKNHPVFYELNSRMIEFLIANDRQAETGELEEENKILLNMFEEAQPSVR